MSYYLASDQGAVGMIAILKDYDTGTDRFYSDPSAMVQTRGPGVFLGKYVGEDLVAKDEFEAVVNTFISIIDAAMYLPRSWIERIDR